MANAFNPYRPYHSTSKFLIWCEIFVLVLNCKQILLLPLFIYFICLLNIRSRHTGEFSYSCEHCGKGFNNFKLLEEHEHIHTGRKPYSCTQCTKSFSNRGSLWLHVKKHETDKPYICDYCSKVGSYQSIKYNQNKGTFVFNSMR